MPIASFIMVGALTVVVPSPNIPLIATVAADQVQFQVDFSQVTMGVEYRIEIKLFDSAAAPTQVGDTQTIDLGEAATVDDIRGFFKAALGNVDLTVELVANSKKVVIKGAPDKFGKIEYVTLTQQGNNLVQDNNLKGPTYVGKVGAPNFSVNGTEIGSKVPVLDFGKLPQTGGPDYEFKVSFQLANGQVIEFPVSMGSAAEPDDALLLVSGALPDTKWNKRQDGLLLMVQDCAGSKVTGVSIIGKGSKPTVRWVLSPPKK